MDMILQKHPNQTKSKQTIEQKELQTPHYFISDTHARNSMIYNFWKTPS